MAKSDTYRLFHVTVKRRLALSPSLVRIVLEADDLDEMGLHGPDQRIKVFFPLPGQPAPRPPEGPDWYARYRALDATTRPPMRTYTISALRPEAREVDVDFVLHGDSGPASRWAGRARAGDRIALLAPKRGADAGGHEWAPPEGARNLLVVADETALPAALGIVRRLATADPAVVAHVLIEVPLSADALAVDVPAHARLQWLPRDGRGNGACLLPALQGLFPATTADRAQHADGPAPDIDRDLLWQRADGGRGDFYAWIAGEAGVVMSIRRHLVDAVGIDRRQITFMGYWRRGRVLD